MRRLVKHCKSFTVLMIWLRPSSTFFVSFNFQSWLMLLISDNFFLRSSLDYLRQTSILIIFHYYHQHLELMSMLLLLNDFSSKHLTSFYSVLFVHKSWWICSERCTHLTLNHALRVYWDWSSILIHQITIFWRFIVWLIHLWFFDGIQTLTFWYDFSFKLTFSHWIGTFK